MILNKNNACVYKYCAKEQGNTYPDVMIAPDGTTIATDGHRAVYVTPTIDSKEDDKWDKIYAIDKDTVKEMMKFMGKSNANFTKLEEVNGYSAKFTMTRPKKPLTKEINASIEQVDARGKRVLEFCSVRDDGSKIGIKVSPKYLKELASMAMTINKEVMMLYVNKKDIEEPIIAVSRSKEEGQKMVQVLMPWR